MRRGQSTVVELVVIAVVALVVIAFVLPMTIQMRSRASRYGGVRCASNLRQIGQALLLYANDNHGHYPVALYSPGPMVVPIWGTDRTAPIANANPLTNPGEQPNDVSAALFMLMREEDITAEVFVCPSTDAEKWDFGGGTNTAQNWCNWTNVQKNLGYSLQNPYASGGAIAKDDKTWWTNNMSADFAVAADLNPGVAGQRSVLGLTVNSSPQQMRAGNSTNHDGDGQNVLYGDGHVEFQNNPLCGVQRDNIYASKNEKVAASPKDATDSVLLPAQP